MERIRFGVVAAFAVVCTLVFIQPVAAQATPTCNGFPATIVGTEGDDRLVGTEGNDVIVGLGGRDIIFGLGGRDVLCGDGGRDRLFGGRQADLLFGGDQGDLLKGSAGADQLFGGQGNDRLIGGNGNDELEGGRGNVDRLSGRGGIDLCFDPKATTLYHTCEFELRALMDFERPATFGSVNLLPGFEPDPFFVDVVAGGSIPAAYLGDPCVGFASSAPDFELVYGNGGDYLEFFYFADEQSEDTAMIVNAPDGIFYCNDDVSGLDPAIAFENPQGGVYDIWISSLNPALNPTGFLGITEDPLG